MEMTTGLPGRRRGRPTVQIVLTEDERQTLERWARRRCTSQALALRSRMVLACAEGLSNVDAATRLGVHAATVGKWRGRFARRRLGGLVDGPRPGGPRTVTDEDVERVVVKTLEEVPRGCDPLVDQGHGPRDGDVTDDGAPHLAGLWPQAACGRHLQALGGPAVH